MSRNRYLIASGAAAILGLTAGCASLPAAVSAEEAKPAAAQAGAEDAKAQAARAAETQGRALLDAFIGNDAAAFLAVLPENLKRQFGVKEFELSRAELDRTLGKPVSYQFDTALAHPLLQILLWKVSFERRNAVGETLRQEAVFRVIAGSVDGETRIVAFNFL